MSFLTQLFKRSDHTANVAHERLYDVLARERTLPLPPAKPVSVTLKETYDGLCIIFGDGDWPELLDNLAMQLESPAMRDFFDGARVRIESETHDLTPSELEELSLLLAEHNMVLNPRRSESQAGKTVQTSVPIIPPEPSRSDTVDAYPEAQIEAGDWPTRQAIDHDPVLLIRHSIVAGQVVYYSGTIIIFGDVSPAAEVIAERDVIVFGRLRGVAHAGSSGNENTMIAALILAPTQIRIGSQIARVPKDQQSHSWPAEIARVQEGRIVVEAWGSPRP
jgi:septum site-determining protein MinC